MTTEPNNTADTLIGEPMIDAKQAATALRLPYYWFADHTMRAKYRIPHFLLGGLVRYRMSDLYAWAAANSATHGGQRKSSDKDEEVAP